MCGSVTPLKWKPQIAPLLAVFGSIFETVWGSSVESELSPGVNYWRCRPQIRGPVVWIFCWLRPAECPWLCVRVGGKQGQWGTWLLHPWHPLKWDQLLWVTGRFTWCGLWIIQGLRCFPPQLYKPQALPPACSQTPTRLELSVSLFERWLDWAKTSCFGLEFLLTSLPILVFSWIMFSACPCASCAQSVGHWQREGRSGLAGWLCSPSPSLKGGGGGKLKTQLNPASVPCPELLRECCKQAY